MTPQEYVKKYWPVGVAAAIASILIVFVIVPWIIGIFVTNAGNKKQEDLIARYNETTNVLSECLVKTKSSVGVSIAQTDAFDKIITNAAKGRYTEGSSAKPGAGNPLFSAIVEAYPNLDGLSKTFENVMITINGCRTDFRKTQSEMQKAVTRFNQWRKGSWTVREFGGKKYPNADLVITVNNRDVTGNDAITQMRKLVVVSDAQSGRDSGHIENLNPYENKEN